jgi:K(+)-stimulated pyrophosphate-energized sodium pump
MIFPLAIAGACVVTSIIGTFFVRLGRSQSIMGALYKGFLATAVLSIGALALVTWAILGFSDDITTSGGVTSTALPSR